MSDLLGLVSLRGAALPSGPLEAVSALSRGLGAQAIRGDEYFLALTGGSSPVQDGSLRTHLVAQARLDNRSDLIYELADGEVSQDSEDDELLLAAYRAWGPGFVRRCYGDFALALWDTGHRRLILARDLLGIEPLCVVETEHWLAFASEPRFLLQLPGVAPDIDELQVALFLSGQAPDPSRSFFRGVRQVLPGHCWHVGAEGTHRTSYWSPDDIRPLRYAQRDEYAAHLREILQACVDSRIPGGSAPWGISMSGGLDSCSVAALACRGGAGGETSRPLALSFVFPTHPSCDESKYLDLMERDVGIPVHRISTQELDVLRDSAPAPDSPFALWDAALRRMLEEIRRVGGEVLLTGQGADDLLAGTSLVLAQRLQQGDVRVVPELVRAARAARRSVPAALYRHLVQPFLPPGIDRLLRTWTGRSVPGDLPDWLHPRLVRRVETYAPEGGFSWNLEGRVRRSLEEAVVGSRFLVHGLDWYRRKGRELDVDIRHPFLDRRLIEWILAIPPAELYVAGDYKGLLRLAMRGVVPEAVRCRRDKTRLLAFVDDGLRTRDKMSVESLLEAPLVAQRRYVDPQRLRASYGSFCRTDSGDDLRRWLFAVMVEIWLRRHASIHGGHSRH